jgi:L-iditol 2-dehydrogenase
MKQSVMTQPGIIEFREIPRPGTGPGEVLVHIQRIGVCGSDIHVYHGLHPYTSYPIVQGHEISGYIAETGAGVSGLSVGDLVTFMPQVTCGTCYSCIHGMEHICESLKVMGFQTNGAGQEFFPVAAEKVLKMPAGVTLDQAAMVEPVAVGVHAIRRAGGAAGKNVLVLGAGTIGNLLAQSARAAGARNVMLSDISAYKLARARACGFDCVIDPRERDIAAAVREYMGPDRADLIFECVGAEETLTTAVDIARKGSTIVIVGVFGKKPPVDIGLVQDRELTIMGTLMYQKPDFEQAVAWLAEGKLALDPLISARFPFERYLDAYHTIEQAHGSSMKVMIELPG